MKRKIILILIALITCASTCSITLKFIKANEKSVVSIKPKIEEMLCGKPEPTYRVGEVSFYNREYCEKHNPACITASGEVFLDTAFTAACSYDYPLGTTLRVSYKDKSVVVRCNDRGGFESKGRVLDLSQASFEALAPRSKGVIETKIEVVYPEYEQFNQYRQNQGLSKLTRNENLEKSAYESAKDIVEGRREWNHNGYQKYITEYYGNWRHIGENLARDFQTFDAVLSGWHNSEKHRAIMQSEDFCEFGLGHYKNVWVLHVGSKRL